MGKKDIEVDRRQIVVQYYLAKWKISNTEVLRIQVSENGNKLSVLIETSGVKKIASDIETKTKGTEALVKDNLNSQIGGLKRGFLDWLLDLLVLLLSKFIKKG